MTKVFFPFGTNVTVDAHRLEVPVAAMALNEALRPLVMDAEGK